MLIRLENLLLLAIILHPLQLNLQQLGHLDERHATTGGLALDLDGRVVKDGVEAVVHVASFLGHVHQEGEEGLLLGADGLGHARVGEFKLLARLAVEGAAGDGRNE